MSLSYVLPFFLFFGSSFKLRTCKSQQPLSPHSALILAAYLLNLFIVLLTRLCRESTVGRRMSGRSACRCIWSMRSSQWVCLPAHEHLIEVYFPSGRINMLMPHCEKPLPNELPRSDGMLTWGTRFLGAALGFPHTHTHSCMQYVLDSYFTQDQCVLFVHVKKYI